MHKLKPLKFVGLAMLLASAGAMTPAAAQQDRQQIMDIQGIWNHRDLMTEDLGILINRVGGAARIGDYTGFPLTEAGRQFTDSWMGARLETPEHQCHPHPTQYSMYGPGNFLITNIYEPLTDRIIGFKLEGTFGRADRTIWLDGRPHPPAYARHTWAGFSTGVWEGNRLTVTTTHLKEGWFQRNGITSTDQAVMREHFIKNDHYLTVITVLQDPDRLEEPFIRTTQAVLDPSIQVGPYECQPFDIQEFNHPRGYVPHWLPGQNPQLTEFSEQFGVPYEAARGGAKTTYPEYIAEIKKWMEDTGKLSASTLDVVE